jgi:PTS system nitrogen regulatory IIA component
MQLTLRDVASFLSVSEATVARWIKQRGLPGQYIAGRYRFNRAELLEWATANQVRVSLEMFDQADPEEEPAVSLAEALEAGGVFYHLQDTTKERALKALVEVLPLPEKTDRELLLRLLLAREAAASTGVGDGIALPHVRNPIVLPVSAPMVTLAFLEKPVEFGALDGKPVNILFSLICPTVRSHLQMLSRLSYALHDVKFKTAVRHQAPREVILAEAQRVETTLSTPDGTRRP